MATVREIAQVAQVSPATVSRMLNGNPCIKENTRRRINEAIEALARETSNEFTFQGKSVGIILTNQNLSDPYKHPALFATMTEFIHYTSQHGIVNSTFIYNSSINLEETFSLSYDGYLIMGTNEKEESLLVNYFTKHKIPHILINRSYRRHRTGCVCIDDEEAMERAVKHLVELGHQAIAFIGGDAEFENTKRRYRGYETIMKAFGLAIRSNNIINGEYSEAGGERAAKLLLGCEPRPTAACCASDAIAVGLIKGLQEAGLRVPEDFAVTGFGNWDIYHSFTPSLTTINQPDKQIGKVAAESMMNLISMPYIDTLQIMIKTGFIVRDSSGGVRNQDRDER